MPNYTITPAVQQLIGGDVTVVNQSSSNLVILCDNPDLTEPNLLSLPPGSSTHWPFKTLWATVSNGTATVSVFKGFIIYNSPPILSSGILSYTNSTVANSADVKVLDDPTSINRVWRIHLITLWSPWGSGYISLSSGIGTTGNVLVYAGPNSEASEGIPILLDGLYWNQPLYMHNGTGDTRGISIQYLEVSPPLD